MAMGLRNGLARQFMQCGSAALSSGSVAWVTFPESFSDVPVVVATGWTTVDSPITIVAGSLVAGSFYAIGKTASDQFSWFAIGP